jgi:hypothetical protein
VRCTVTQAMPQLMLSTLARCGFRLIAWPEVSKKVPARCAMQAEEVGIDAN